MRQELEAAWKEGRRSGLEEGRRSGLEEGRRSGLEEGLRSGLEEGRRSGLEEGREQILEQQIQKKLAKGKSVSEIAAELEETEERIQDLIRVMHG